MSGLSDVSEAPEAVETEHRAPYEPREGVPDVITDPTALAAYARRLASGTGPLALDAERASGYRYSQRAYLGAIQNRLDHTVSNLTNIATNTEASRSRIMDADYGAESANLAKAQIIQQAATAMLAQANQSAQSVLSLLQ